MNVVATGGDDYGIHWEPPKFFDLPDAKFDVGMPIDIGDDTPLPTVWQRDVDTGIWFRGPTAREVEANRWPENAWLIVAPDFVFDVTNGVSPTVIPIPIVPLPSERERTVIVEPVRVERRASHNLVSFAEFRMARGRVIPTISRPTFHLYQQPGLDWDFVGDDLIVGVFGDSDGGVFAMGALVDRTFTLRGPFREERGRIVIEVPPPVGDEVLLLSNDFGRPLEFSTIGAPAVSPGLATLAVHSESLGFTPVTDAPIVASGDGREGQCADSLDNDHDARADACDYACVPHGDFGGDRPHVRAFEQTKNFGLFGDAMFCTGNQDWKSVAHAAGVSAAQFLHWVHDTIPAGTYHYDSCGLANPPPNDRPYDLGARIPPIRLRMAGCTVFADRAAAEACHFNGTCPQGATYPFEGLGDDMASHFGPVWDAVDQTADAVSQSLIADAHPISLAVALVNQADPDNPEGAWGGLAYVDFLPHQNNPKIVGSAASYWETYFYGNPSKQPCFNCSLLRLVHEMGHLLGLPHDDGEYCNTLGTNCYPGFMNISGGTQPVLGKTLPGEENQALQCLHPYQIWTLEGAQAPAGKWFPRSSGFKWTGCSSDSDCPAGFGLECRFGRCLP
jgi:hypothetical protein